MELEEIRKEIDKIDEHLLALFCRRMDRVREVAEYKIENQMQVLHPEREKAILEKISEKAEDGYEDYAVEFFHDIMRISRKMQRRLIAETKDPSEK